MTRTEHIEMAMNALGAVLYHCEAAVHDPPAGEERACPFPETRYVISCLEKHASALPIFWGIDTND